MGVVLLTSADTLAYENIYWLCGPQNMPGQLAKDKFTLMRIMFFVLESISNNNRLSRKRIYVTHFTFNLIINFILLFWYPSWLLFATWIRRFCKDVCFLFYFGGNSCGLVKFIGLLPGLDFTSLYYFLILWHTGFYLYRTFKAVSSYQ